MRPIYLFLPIILCCACGDGDRLGADARAVDAGPPVDAQQPDAKTLDAETLDAEDAVDSQIAVDQGLDASPSGELGRRWLASVASRAGAFCQCEVAVRDYETVEECRLAEGALAASECADSALLARTSLHAGFICVAEEFEAQARCMASAGCDPSALNACESIASMQLAACPPTPADAVQALFDDIRQCITGENVACPNMEVEGEGEVATGTTLSESNDYAPSCAAGGDVAPDATIGWTVPADGIYQIDTFGSSFDTQLAIFAECGGAEIACNDDAGDRRTSRVEVEVSAGDHLIIVVDGFDELSVGSFVLHVRQR